MESGWSPRIIRICRGAVLVAELRAGGGVGVSFKQANAGFATHYTIAVTFDRITLRYNNTTLHRCKYSPSIGKEYNCALIV